MLMYLDSLLWYVCFFLNHLVFTLDITCSKYIFLKKNWCCYFPQYLLVRKKINNDNKILWQKTSFFYELLVNHVYFPRIFFSTGETTKKIGFFFLQVKFIMGNKTFFNTLVPIFEKKWPFYHKQPSWKNSLSFVV